MQTFKILKGIDKKINPDILFEKVVHTAGKKVCIRPMEPLYKEKEQEEKSSCTASFPVRVVDMWNRLLPETKSTERPATFKKFIKLQSWALAIFFQVR